MTLRAVHIFSDTSKDRRAHKIPPGHKVRTHQRTGAARSSSRRVQVCQLSLAMGGNPNTGSTLLASHCLVTGSAAHQLHQPCELSGYLLAPGNAGTLSCIKARCRADDGLDSGAPGPCDQG